MSGNKLDQIVKGAPPPGTLAPSSSGPSIISRTSSPAPPLERNDSDDAQSPPTPDPLSTLPSSPPQIYLNLLILEASLRSQYLHLRARRRQHTFFLLVLTSWIAYFFYALFLRPREDGSGVGGSVYWVVEMAEKVALMGGIVTGLLMWGTGQWDHGMRWPRRWIGVTNRGLRTFNVKVVVIKGPWWKELLSHVAFLFPFAFSLSSGPSSYRYIDPGFSEHFNPPNDDDVAFGEEDLTPGGDHVKVLLLPKPFSPDFREGWDLYRSEYWEKENDRRSRLRQVLRKRERQVARERSPWFWWVPDWHIWRRYTGHPQAAKYDLEKSRHRQQHLVQNEKGSRKRRPSFARESSQSRTASRSSTPSTLDPMDERPVSSRVRRGSSTVSGGGGEKKRKAKNSASSESMRASSRLSSVA